MPLSIDKPKLDNLANEIWKSAERLRGKFKAYEYQNVVLPIIVLRRLECVLLKWREKSKAEIREKQPERSEADIDALVKKLEQNVQQTPFSNETDWTLRKVFEEDHTLLEENFRAYLNGFSNNVDDIPASKYGRDYFEATGKRTTNLASTNATKVRAFPIPLPPLPEQKRLVKFLEDRLRDLEQIQKTLKNQITTLLAYRKSLIHECVTGKRQITEVDVARVQDEAPEEWRRKQP